MPDSDRLTIRLGPLKQPLDDYCQANGATRADVMREALAAFLNQPVPEMVVGNPDIGEQASKGGKARAKAMRKAKKRKSNQ